MGAMNIVFGRNIWQSRNSTKIVKVIVKIVHQGATAEEVIDELK